MKALVLVATVGLTALIAVPLAAAGPEQVHVSPTADGVGLVVQWASSTPMARSDAVVRWQAGDGAAQTTAAELVGRSVGVADAPAATLHYAATLGPFPPGTDVTYQVGAGMDLSRPWVVTTPRAEEVRLVAYGDVGSDSLGQPDAPVDVLGPQHAVQFQVLRQAPDLQVVLGDLAYESTNAGWDRFMRFMEGSAAQVPTVAAIGNHEWLNDVDRYEQFLQRFVLPGDEQNYVVVSGPLRLVVLNSDLVCLAKAPQGALPAEPPCERGQPNPAALAVLDGLQPFDGWTVATFHHPPLSSGPHGLDAEPQGIGVRELWRPRLEAAGVDVVLTAHDHMYERSHQVRGDAVVDTDARFAKGNGTVYVVAGGGGRELYEFEGPAPAWSAVRNVTHHLVVLDVTAEGLAFKAVGADGRLVDAFAIGNAQVAVPAEPSGVEDDFLDIAGLAGLPAAALALALALVAVRRRRHW